MRKFLFITFLFGILIIFSPGLLRADLDTDTGETQEVSSSVSGDNEMLSQKLTKIISTQEQILRQLDELKAELQVVKIRISSR